MSGFFSEDLKTMMSEQGVKGTTQIWYITQLDDKT
jgi:hypothetical protein